MLRLSNEKEELDIVSDQIGTPTYATDLVSLILYIVENKFIFVLSIDTTVRVNVALVTVLPNTEIFDDSMFLKDRSDIFRFYDTD